MTATREELELLIDVAEWGDLRAHLERDRLIIVDNSLELADAAVNIADDAATVVSGWIKDGKLGKPSQARIELWNQEKQKKFRMLIVSPFVLIQER